MKTTNTPTTVTIPKELCQRLNEVRQFIIDDLHVGETVPSLEELVIQAICETYGAP